MTSTPRGGINHSIMHHSSCFFLPPSQVGRLHKPYPLFEEFLTTPYLSNLHLLSFDRYQCDRYGNWSALILFGRMKTHVRIVIPPHLSTQDGLAHCCFSSSCFIDMIGAFQDSFGPHKFLPLFVTHHRRMCVSMHWVNSIFFPQGPQTTALRSNNKINEIKMAWTKNNAWYFAEISVAP